jgi:uncharacterized protein (TIGR00297 family)
MPSPSEATALALITLAVVGLLGASELLRRRFDLPAEFSRKVVHVGTGLVIFFAPMFIAHTAPVLLIAVVFTLANIAAYARGWLPSVHHTARRSYGTVYYPLALAVLAPLLWHDAPEIVAAAMLVLAVGDGAAGIVGELARTPRRYTLVGDEKSVEGSVAMFLASLAALHLALAVYPDRSIPVAALLESAPVLLFATLVAISAAATAAEALTPRGLDNLSVPLVTALLLYMSFGSDSLLLDPKIATAAALGGIVAWTSHRLHLLSASGSVATFLLAVLVHGAGGWAWTLPIVAFFLLSSALSRLGRARKRAFDGVFEKTSTRDAMQVAANGGVAGAIAVLARIAPWDGWFVLYLGALAAATADTWSTELGVLARGRVRSVLTLRSVPAGTSGGVSLAGTLGGALGAAVVAAIGMVGSGAWDAGVRDAGIWGPLAMLTAAGLAGSLVDSVLGATLQAQYRCGYCGGETERRVHCHLPTTLVRGRAAVDNDLVNIACTVAGAAVALVFVLI